MAAAAQDLSVSAYVTTLLERVVPIGGILKRPADGTVSAETLRRFAALRAEQAVPFPEDSADLIRESRTERETRL